MKPAGGGVTRARLFPLGLAVLLSGLAHCIGLVVCIVPPSAAQEVTYSPSAPSRGVYSNSYGGRQVFTGPGATAGYSPASQFPRSSSGGSGAARLADRHDGSPYLTEPVDVDPYLREPLDAMILDAEESQSSSPFARPPGSHEGVFQGVSFSGAWLAKPAEADLGVTEFELGAKFGLPLPLPDANLLVSPALAVDYFDGPTAPDLPASVYEAGLGISVLRPVGQRWFTTLNVTPLVASDFKADQSEALRITGSGVALYQWNPYTRLVLGAVYLDRRDVSVLPAAGIIWIPNDDWRFELVSPRPRIAWRFGCPSAMTCVEHWAYVAFEFGGGQWAVVRSSGAHDVVTLRDYRFLFGVERKAIGGVTARFEIGYVFGRALEYASATPDFDPDDTLLLRVGATY